MSEAGDLDYRLLFEHLPGLYLILRPDLVIVAVSDSYLRATMTIREEILGRGLFDVFPDNPDDPAATGVSHLRASLERVVATMQPDTMAVQKYDIRRSERDGGGFEVRYWSPVNSPVVGADGSLVCLIHRVEDVTEFVRLRQHGHEQERISDELRSRAARIEAEVLARAQEIAETNRQLQRANAELQRSEAFLESIVENIPDMIFVKDASTRRFVRLNRAGEELLGRSRAEMIGRTDDDLFAAAEAASSRAMDDRVFAEKRVVDIAEEPVTSTARGPRILHTKKIPIRDADGQPTFLVGISEDVTERKQAEDALRAAREAAEAANLAKSDFLSRMSHELRTPLNAILGFSQLLAMDAIAPDQLENVHYITRAGRHLLDLINDVLDISRIESRQLAISPEPVPVRDLIEEVAGLVRPTAEGRLITLEIRAAACDRFVMADRQRLRQVLLNLLSNAVKYNRHAGRIRVACRPAPPERLRVDVTDTGYGIPAEAIGRLFTAFDRLGAEQGAIEGTGMGLALSKGLMEAMGGNIGVESTLDVGSTFWIELALAEGPVERYRRAGTGPTAGADAGRPQRLILQIEDNLSNQRLIAQILALRPRHRLMSTTHGQAGIELATTHSPDLILLDVHLPDIPGHEVLRLLRTHPSTREIPVVVVSADATKTQMTRMLDAGAFGYLTKPLDVAELLAVLDRALPPTPSV